MLKYRLIFGSLMIAAIVALVLCDERLTAVSWPDELTGIFHRESPPPGLLFLAFTVVLIPFAVRELSALLRNVGVPSHSLLASFGAIATCVSLYATPRMFNAPTGTAIIGTVLIACFVITLLVHSRDTHIHGVIAAAGAVLFTIILLGLMPGFYLSIRRWHSGWVVVGVILITKSGDIGAYFTGRAIGKHKLIPWLSPKKTWEGLAGGIVLAALVATGFAWLSQVTDLTTVYLTNPQTGIRELVPKKYDPALAAFAGVLLALVGHAGDLMVSLFKRDAGVKDSGSAIPGFGGLLDVIDSPLLVAPVAFWMLEWAAGGGTAG
ncbi:MAG: phosphatidate cytidylyltransferase [Phycisphaerales bacterium]